MGGFEGETRFRSENFVLEETKGRFVLSTLVGTETRSTRIFFTGVRRLTQGDFELLLDGEPIGLVSQEVSRLLVIELERIVEEGKPERG